MAERHLVVNYMNSFSSSEMAPLVKYCRTAAAFTLWRHLAVADAIVKMIYEFVDLSRTLQLHAIVPVSDGTLSFCFMRFIHVSTQCSITIIIDWEFTFKINSGT